MCIKNHFLKIMYFYSVCVQSRNIFAAGYSTVLFHVKLRDCYHLNTRNQPWSLRINICQVRRNGDYAMAMLQQFCPSLRNKEIICKKIYNYFKNSKFLFLFINITSYTRSVHIDVYLPLSIENVWALLTSIYVLFVFIAQSSMFS